jgi:hypothetical protein
MSTEFDFNIIEGTIEDIGDGDSIFNSLDVEPLAKPEVKPPKVEPAKEKTPEEEEEPPAPKLFNEEEEPASTDNEDSQNQFEILAEEFFKLNILKQDEDEEGNLVQPELPKTAEEFKNLWENQAKERAASWLESYLSKHGEDRRELFEAIFEKGVDPKEYIPLYNKVQDWNNVDIEEVSNQEKVVREYFKRLEWEDSDIDEQIENLKDTSKLEVHSKKYLSKLVEQDTSELKQIELDKEQKNLTEKRMDSEFKQNVTKLLSEAIKAKEIEGIPVSEKIAQETFDFVYTKKWKTPSGEQLTDLDKFIIESKKPENHKTRVILGLLAKNNFDLSKVKKVAVSKQSDELFSKLTTKNKTVSKSGSESNKFWDGL